MWMYPINSSLFLVNRIILKQKILQYYFILCSWKIITCRILVNTAVLILLTLSAYAVVEVVARSTESEANSTWWRQNETTVVMTLINSIFPIFFEILGIFEHYHPRKQLRLQLAR